MRTLRTYRVRFDALSQLRTAPELASILARFTHRTRTMLSTPNGHTLCCAYTATGSVRLTIKRDGSVRTEVWADAHEALARAAMLAQRTVAAEADAAALARGLFGTVS